VAVLVSAMTTTVLDGMNLGFRERYLLHDEVTAQLRAWAERFPEVARLRSLGQSLEGRDLWLLELGPEPDRDRPSVWIDGNMHAQEVSGSSVALAIAEDVLRLQLDPDLRPHGLPPSTLATLRELRFFVLPRMCPDGAEQILTSGRYARSNPRDRRPHQKPRWVSGDVDGDGLAMLMRLQDPSGDFVESKAEPGLMVPRELDDEGPFFRIFPEGHIESFDGTLPEASYLSDNDTDLNRNFPWSWAPEPDQIGAGAFPTSEPESRAVVAFTSAHPSIFAWLNLHTFGGVYIRPPGHLPDHKMDQEDLALFRQLEAWGEEHGGYPTVSGYTEFLYEPEKPLRGDLADYAYHQRGALALVCELWDLFAQAGLPRKKPFVSSYSHLSRTDLESIARWDREHNRGRCLRPWVPVQHPQLGAVEVGGLDPRVGLANPSLELLPQVCARQTAFLLRMAAMAPRLVLGEPRITPLGGDLHQVEIEVRNLGYLGTQITQESRRLPWNEGVFVTAQSEGVTLVEPTAARQALGHLEGWGHGRFSGHTTIFLQRSHRNRTAAQVRFLVRGTGVLQVRAGSTRTGWIETRIDL
jgi:hypothetical protein